MVDELDRPLSGALVVAIGARPHASAAALDAAALSLADADPAASCAVVAGTESDGRFSLPALPPGHYILFAMHIGPPAAASETLRLDGSGFSTVPLRLVISRRRSLL